MSLIAVAPALLLPVALALDAVLGDPALPAAIGVLADGLNQLSPRSAGRQ